MGPLFGFGFFGELLVEAVDAAVLSDKALLASVEGVAFSISPFAVRDGPLTESELTIHKSRVDRKHFRMRGY